MNIQWLCCLAAGGAIGTILRGVVAALWQTRFPWATLVINIFGSLLIGYFMVRIAAMESPSAARWQAFLVTGFCGGFTTFSAFSWQTLEQINKGEIFAAFANIALSVSLCLLFVWLGFLLGKMQN